ncbi:MAG TPA: CapA family protein, partial [Anaerolineales bacterium]|nr:CapA family protein [Anaerolineales bacterium]
MLKLFPRSITFMIVLILLMSACAPGLQSPSSQPPVSNSPISFTPTNPSVQISTSTPEPIGSYIGNAVPDALRKQVEGLNVRLDISSSMQPNPNSFETHIRWVYALVAPFPTVRDGVTFDELHVAWSEGTAPAPFTGRPLLIDESTLAAFTAIWDVPAQGSVKVMASDQLLDTAWSELPSWVIIPFESLEPRWKVLTIDGQSPIRKNFDLSNYPLLVNFDFQSSNSLQSPSLPSSNYDVSKLTTIIMTGVTALVRATALTMEIKGTTYPGEKIRDVMREADITHVSNEIPFFTGCTYPKPDQAALVFCSDPKYMDLLTDIGIDVVELTGNHFADRGADGMLETIAIYNANALPYFGGGTDLKDSLEPALFEVNGNKIAFIGCNKPDVNRFPTATDYH